MRHLAIGGGKFNVLEDLGGPMSDVLDHFVNLHKQVQRYNQKYGELPAAASTNDENNNDSYRDSDDDGSETEQE